MYSELLTKLRLISEKDMFTNSPVQKLLADEEAERVGLFGTISRDFPVNPDFPDRKTE